MNKYFECLKRYFRDESASTLPLAALAFPVILGFAGLGTDAAYWMSEKRELQAAADAAVLAAGYELANDSSDYMDTAAVREAQRNGYHSDANGVLQLNTVSSGSDGVVAQCPLSCGSDDYQRRFVLINGTGNFTTIFPYPGIADSISISTQARVRVD